MNGVPETRRSDLAVKAAPRPRGMPWNFLALLLAYSFLSWFNRVSMSVAGTEKIIHEGILTETQMGDVYSALLIAYAVCMTPGGYFSDRAGPRTALIVMGFGSAVFVAMTGVTARVLLGAAGLYAGLIAVRGLMGVFTAPVYPAACRVVSLEVPARRRAEANGLIMGAALLGIAATPFAFGSLIDRLDWPNAFMVMGVVTAALSLVWVAVTKRRPVVDRNAPAEPLPKSGRMGPSGWSLFRSRGLVLLTVAYAAVGYFEYLFYFWTEYYFKDVMKLNQEISRGYTTILYVSMALGMFSGGWLADRLSRSIGSGRARVLVPIAGLLGGAVFLGLGLYTSQPQAVVACLALALAAVGVCEGPLWAMALELGGRHGGTAAGIFNTGGNVGGMLAPAITPRLAKAFGWTGAVSVAIAACLAGVVLLLCVNPHERAPGDVWAE